MNDTKERKEKIKATRDANKAKWESQTITIDEHWRLIRADELNWELQKDEQFQGYFGTLHGAFRSIPAKMLNAEASGSIQEIQRCQAVIVERIDNALLGL